MWLNFKNYVFCKHTNNLYKTDSLPSNEFNFPSSYIKENRSITSLSLGESQYLPCLIKTHPQAVKSVKMVRQETLQLPQLSTHKICRVRAECCRNEKRPSFSVSANFAPAGSKFHRWRREREIKSRILSRWHANELRILINLCAQSKRVVIQVISCRDELYTLADVHARDNNATPACAWKPIYLGSDGKRYDVNWARVQELAKT